MNLNLTIGLIIICSLFAVETSEAQSTTPWRLSSALELSDSFTLSGTQRSRYEALVGQFRSSSIGKDQIFVLRTALKAQLSLNPVEFVAEIMDSRQYLADGSTPVNTGIVNALELLQGYVAFNIDGVRDGKLQILFGRHTMDVSTRRLVARNRYRNTINNFTGINGTWISSAGHAVRVFYVLPVNRLPSVRARVVDNEIDFDEEDFDRKFWGVHVARANVFPNVTGQFFLLGLHEDDNATLNTRNRNFITTGVYFVRRPAKGKVDFDLESYLQIGTSRASTAATDVTDLDHRAHFQHFLVGYTLDIPSSLRLVFQFDYSSGDSDPTDGNNNRFDTLFGARRFDYGPTGIYGAFARSNLISPGYRLIVNPVRGVNVMFAHRLYWLASSKDTWTTGRVADPTGNSGSYLGTQPEIRIRWEALPGNLRVETGVAYYVKGGFVDNAPNSNGEGNATYGYLQTALTF